MNDIPSSSFIPKQSLSAVPQRVRRRRTFSIFKTITLVIFFGSLVLTGGTFVYKKQALSQNNTIREELRALQGKYNSGDVSAVRKFAKQLDAAAWLLKNHIAPSKLLESLEQNSMARIQYIGFSLEHDPSYDIMIKLSGGTQEFKTIALQSVEFKNEPLFDDAVFSEIGTSATVGDIKNDSSTKTNKNGQNINQHEVVFSISGLIEPSSLAYDGVVINSPPPRFEEENPTASTSPETNSSNQTP